MTTYDLGAGGWPAHGITLTDLAPPWVSITSCLGAPSPSSSCGPLVFDRTDFNNDWCERRQRVRNGTLSLRRALQGAVLDVAFIDGADDAFWVDDGLGPAHVGGMVGEILADVAIQGNFTYRAFVVRRPDGAGDTYGGSWQRYLVDWIHRADLLATWWLDTVERREIGVDYLYNFYQLDPQLIISSQTERRHDQFWSDIWAFGRPFTIELWTIIIVLTFATGFFFRWAEGRMRL